MPQIVSTNVSLSNYIIAQILRSSLSNTLNYYHGPYRSLNHSLLLRCSPFSTSSSPPFLDFYPPHLSPRLRTDQFLTLSITTTRLRRLTLQTIFSPKQFYVCDTSR